MEHQPKPPAQRNNNELETLALAGALVFIGGLASGDAVSIIEHGMPHPEIAILVNSVAGVSATIGTTALWRSFWRRRENC